MIVDEFVVELGLDTKNFNEQQRKALDGVRKWSEDIEKRMKALQDANKKTAYSVQDITAAAQGLFSVLAGAEFGHFVMNTVNSAAATGRMATNIGVASSELIAFNSVVSRNGGDAQASAASMKSFVDQVERLNTYGEASDSFFRGFGRLQEVGAKIGDKPAEVIGHLADFADKHRGEANMVQQANLIGADLGLNQDQINIAIRGRTQLLKDYEDAAKTALSPEQTQKLTNFQHAWRGLTGALTGAAEKGIADTIEPFTKAADAAGEWARNNQSVVEGLTLIIGSLAGLKAVAAVMRAIAWMRGLAGGAAAAEAAAGAAGAGAAGAAGVGLGTMAAGAAAAAGVLLVPTNKSDEQMIYKNGQLTDYGRQITGQGGGGGAFGSQKEKEGYIRQAAITAGIDPDVAMRVARSEGFNKYTGDNGTSFGSFQLHLTPGGRGRAVGDQFKEKRGLDPSNPSTEPEQIMFAMEWVKRHGWGDFHGAANSGIGQWQGVGGRGTEVNIATVNVIAPSNDPKALAKGFTEGVGSKVQSSEAFAKRTAQQANTGLGGT